MDLKASVEDRIPEPVDGMFAALCSPQIHRFYSRYDVLSRLQRGW
jgi:hypothetical protein